MRLTDLLSKKKRTAMWIGHGMFRFWKGYVDRLWYVWMLSKIWVLPSSAFLSTPHYRPHGETVAANCPPEHRKSHLVQTISANKTTSSKKTVTQC